MNKLTKITEEVTGRIVFKRLLWYRGIRHSKSTVHQFLSGADEIDQNIIAFCK